VTQKVYKKVDLSNMTHHSLRKETPSYCGTRRPFPPTSTWEGSASALVRSYFFIKVQSYALHSDLPCQYHGCTPKNITSNGSGFWRRDGIAQALPNKIIQLRSSLCLALPVPPWGAAGRRVAGGSWGCSARWAAPFRRTGSQQPVHFRTPPWFYPEVLFFS
jgi:hypothetical protein